jgi:hypothetical protein
VESFTKRSVLYLTTHLIGGGTSKMKSRLTHFGVLLVSVLALMAGFAPSGSANTIGGLIVQGTATVGAGLSYPCVGNGAPDLTKCPPPIGAGNGPIGVTFNGLGVGQIDNVGKPKCGGLPACLEAGVWAITATGTINGWCGLSSGTLNGTISPTLALGTKSKVRSFSITYSSAGGVLVITGSTNKGETIAGAVHAAADVTTGSSCTNKAAKNFIVAGIVSIVRV